MTDSDLHDLLEKCRTNNKSRQITGMLMYIDGKFIQVLEGSKKSINEMFEIIMNDKRHKKISKIIEGRTLKRTFGKWTMGFKSLPGKSRDDEKGFEELVNYFKELDINENSHVTQVFLRLFYNKYYTSEMVRQ